MKKLIKYAPLIIAICAIADTQFELLKDLGLNATLINSIKLFGLLLSVFLPSITETFSSLSKRNTDPTKPVAPNKKPPR